MKIAFFDETTSDNPGKHRIDGLAEALGLKRIKEWSKSTALKHDVVIVEHLDRNAILASLDLIRKPTKLILRLNAMELYRGGLSNIEWETVDTLVVHGEHLKQYFLERWNLLSRDKIKVIPLGVDTNKFKREPIESNFKVAVVSEIHWRKGVQELPVFAEKFSNLEFFVAGNVIDHDCMNYLKWKLNQKNLTERVKFVGWQDDMVKFYSDKSFLLHLSYTEGMPRVVFEAQSMGIFPLVRKYRGAEDQIVGGRKFDTYEDIEWIPENNETTQKSLRLIALNFDINQTAEKFKEVL